MRDLGVNITDGFVEDLYDAKQILLKSMISEVGEERICEVWKITDIKGMLEEACCFVNKEAVQNFSGMTFVPNPLTIPTTVKPVLRCAAKRKVKFGEYHDARDAQRQKALNNNKKTRNEKHRILSIISNDFTYKELENNLEVGFHIIRESKKYARMNGFSAPPFKKPNEQIDLLIIICKEVDLFIRTIWIVFAQNSGPGPGYEIRANAGLYYVTLEKLNLNSLARERHWKDWYDKNGFFWMITHYILQAIKCHVKLDSTIEFGNDIETAIHDIIRTKKEKNWNNNWNKSLYE
ncbi:hypothetical protein C1645_836723 [Glomus cerebriforme]|uniref:Uncharacterized protein n=1 Tax=Glomus cerebriforme TaxID=658196 RepID=A0A397S6J3_9GLOM|nr:hypothetical protein C1645_836723 [Glomus cerebriforme]